ncbi:hypothetical protein [Prochlorococcus sp. MIT 1341]|uniref:hypothetical protein n=1 Tax=Prochlorococcus sp. MIT 1341 TaxID=3096221 RepID=UPI002A74F5B5|nr:hypothetical protein [Prochlorococcus sp. MIT 1341]
MISKSTSSAWLVGGVPAILGLGIAWFGATLIKNENRLLHRQLELKAALGERSRKIRRRNLLGK